MPGPLGPELPGAARSPPAWGAEVTPRGAVCAFCFLLWVLETPLPPAVLPAPFCPPNPALPFSGAAVSSFAVFCSVAAAVPLVPPRLCWEWPLRSATDSGPSAASPGGVEPLRASPSSPLLSRTVLPPAQVVFHKTAESSLLPLDYVVKCSISPWVSGESCQERYWLGRGEEGVNPVVATPEGPALASAFQQRRDVEVAAPARKQGKKGFLIIAPTFLGRAGD